MRGAWVVAVVVGGALLACTGSQQESSPEPEPTPIKDKRKPGKSKQGRSKAEKNRRSGGELEGYNGRFRGDPKWTAVDVVGIRSKDLQQVRNEIFAQYGRPFTSDAMRNAFAKKSWYKENPDYTDDWLTNNDKANAALIQSFESKDDNKKATAARIDVGEYSSNDKRLLLHREKQAEIIESGGDVYNWEPNEQKWFAMGDWVVTYTGDKGVAKAGEVWLWKLNDQDQRVVSVERL